MTTPVVLDVDTGTDDAGALLLAATHPGLQLEGVLATWGNCARDHAVRNTLVVLEAADSPAAVYPGHGEPCSSSPTVMPATVVMGTDGLGDVALPDPQRAAAAEDAAQALVRQTREQPGVLTLVALAPLTTVAAALRLDPELPRRLAGLVVMGGAIAVGGNVTAAAEANIAHDPQAAAEVIDAFAAADALAGEQPPRLVPLDVTLAAPLTLAELAALENSSLPGTTLLHRVWSAIWATGVLETGISDVWPAHDLLATWSLIDHDVCTWELLPLQVDLGGGAAWGATVADRRVARIAPAAREGRWAVATGVDADRFRAGVRAWLAG